jgi:hypothetical protein
MCFIFCALNHDIFNYNDNLSLLCLVLRWIVMSSLWIEIITTFGKQLTTHLILTDSALTGSMRIKKKQHWRLWKVHKKKELPLSFSLLSSHFSTFTVIIFMYVFVIFLLKYSELQCWFCRNDEWKKVMHKNYQK